VIIAMVTVRMVKVAIDQVIDVIPVWHGFVPASGSVNVAGFVPAAVVIRGASVRVLLTDFESMLIHVTGMWVMQMAVMEKIDMPVVPYRSMAAVLAMPVVMVGMVRQFTSAHA